MILALETSTDVCSVAFKNESGKVFEKCTESRGSHSEKLFIFISELMEEHQFSIDELSAVLVSEGPGSYTGLRIAASGVKGLLFGTEIPLYGVSTLASYAWAAHQQKTAARRTHAIIDARRVHVYHQLFSVKEDVIKTLDEVKIIPISSFEEMIQSGDLIIGTGLDRLDKKVTEKAPCFGTESISARSLIALYEEDGNGQFIHKVSPEDFDPKYYTSNQVG